jgi:hypothetical protein
VIDATVDDQQIVDAGKKAEAQFEDLSKKLAKSQSKDQIDQRAEECIKRFSGT